MNCLQTSLYNLLEDNNFVPSKEYKASIASYLHSDSSLTPQAMGKLTGEIFQSKQTMAYYLLHNAINEEEGAERLKMIANRYAQGEMKQQIMHHCQNDRNHSAMYASLIPLTGYQTEVYQEEKSSDFSNVSNFYDDIKIHLFRAHSVELRSWCLLVSQLSFIDQSDIPYLKEMRPTIQQILDDEVKQVSYTAQHVSQWLEEDPSLCQAFTQCMNHTYRETWDYLASMAEFMRDSAPYFMV
ncbi:GTPase [Vibrio owensii]|uniref:GTPase n=1 Tax=Vibrio owensii TaxID=696485 RepID=UPI00289527E8|nr:GTPase [Vibrio owensii]CAH1553618.1 GTPase [Vibrio owensii]